MDFEPFDVVVVPFPFTDKPVSKRRLALIVSTSAFNSRHDQVILAMITSARQSDWPSDVHLQDWQAEGLSVPCRVRFKLFTLGKAMIVSRLSQLSDNDRRTVKTALSDTLAAS